MDATAATLLRAWNQRRLDARGENRIAWHGTLLRVGIASDQPPQGSESHRILISKELAQRKCKDLLQMPINCAFNLAQHQKPAILGIIRQASVEGDALVVSGWLWSKNRPDLVELVKRHQGQLGMSFEASDTQPEDESAAVWRLKDMEFTGASVLYTQRAALHQSFSPSL